MGTAEIVTDEGRAYIKAMGNPQGPHALACEWVGSLLAHWFGLPTFDFATMRLDDLDELPFQRGGRAKPGTAFLTRAEKGHTWGGSDEELLIIDNPDDVARLVVFDTWTLNCDRFAPDPLERKPNYDNVFLSEESAAEGQFRLIAMDHTHCFTCGRDLTHPVATIERTKDVHHYGLFPGFVPIVRGCRGVVEEAALRLRRFESEVAQRFVDSIPQDWEVSRDARTGLCDLVCQRARFVADNVVCWLAPSCWPQGELKYEKQGDD